MGHSQRLFGLTLLVGILGTSPTSSQVKFPKPPDKYAVEFRYRIKADRNERVRQFLEMQKFLEKIGFDETEGDDTDLAMFDPSAERMVGTVPSATARQLLGDPRVQTVLLMPPTFKPPQDEKERVKVYLELSRGFTPERQQLFARQVKQVLAGFGLQEAVSYDHRGYSVVRGTMPWVRVPMLLKDLRGQPAGWFLPLTHEDELPAPFKTLLPVRLIEVLPEEGAPAPVQGQAALPPVTPEQPQAAKLNADVRRHLLQEGKKDEPLRVEINLNYTPEPGDTDWRDQLKHLLPTTAIEGRLGSVVTVTVVAGDQVNTIARLPFVQAIRLPRGGSAPAAPKEEPKKEEKDKGLGRLTQVQAVKELDVLKELRLDRLHALGKRGAGVRVAVIDTDFTGHEKFLGKQFPKTTLYVDLTAERNPAVRPEPSATPAGELGRGTRCALAVRLAAPDADVALVRVAPDAPYQVMTAYRYMLGEFLEPESFRTRREELELDAAAVRAERNRANEQYRKAFDNFEDDDAARAARRAAREAVAAVEKKEVALTLRANRLLKLERDLLRLKGTAVILNAVGWNSGQPLDATSTLSRLLDEKMTVARPKVVRNASRLPKPTVWFQAAGDTRGQSWLGDFKDADGNGIMEWAPAGTLPRPGRWTPELNFLAFRPADGKDAPDLPAGARVRVSVQWREPHDPEVSEVEYRRPIAPLDLMLVRQRDPGAGKLATDEVEVIARSEGDADRLTYGPEFGVYEQSIDVTLPAAGHYALRIDGRHPLGTRPGGTLGIRDQEIHWEFRPRVFIEVLDGETLAKGRVVFGDYQTEAGGVAVPADARTVVAVGAMDGSKRLRPYAALGAGPNTELLAKPDVMTYDDIPSVGPAGGSPIAAALAAGTGASLLSGGANPASFLNSLKVVPGSPFVVPENWVRR